MTSVLPPNSTTGTERLIAEVAQRHADVLDDAREAAVAKAHARGQLTARERVNLLLDPFETLLESGPLVVPADRSLQAAADSLIVGLGRINGRTSVVVSCDYTALGGSLGINSHVKLTRAMHLAERYELPVFIVSEGGGARAQEYQSLPSLRPSDAFPALARLSGRVPLIGIAPGRAFAGHAILLGECDVVIATESAAAGIAGPPLVKAATGQDLTPEQIGGAAIHAAAGGVELLVADDRAAIAEARRYGAYVTEPIMDPSGEPGDPEGFRGLAEAAQVDVRAATDLLADPGSLLELRPAWHSEVLTAVGRVDGHAVGILAIGPSAGDEQVELSALACDKIARFAQLCAAFALPQVRLIGSVDLPAPGQAGEADLFRRAARIVRADAAGRGPALTFVVGCLAGTAQALLGGFSRFTRGPFLYLWPGATVARLGSPAAGATAFEIAESYGVDDVIDPIATRSVAAATLALLPPGRAGGSGAVEVW